MATNSSKKNTPQKVIGVGNLIFSLMFRGEHGLLDDDVDLKSRDVEEGSTKFEFTKIM